MPASPACAAPLPHSAASVPYRHYVHLFGADTNLLQNSVVANEYDAVDLLLLYFQNASTVSTFTLGWSKLLVTVPFLVLAIVNFDVTYMSWDCLLPMQHSPVLSYGFGFVLQLALPVLLAAVNYVYYRLLRMFSRLGGAAWPNLAPRSYT